MRDVYRETPLAQRRLDRALKSIAPHIDPDAIERDTRQRIGALLRDALCDKAQGQGASVESLTFISRLARRFWRTAFGELCGRVSFSEYVRVAALAGYRIEHRLVPLDPAGEHNHATVEWARQHMAPFTTRDWLCWHDEYLKSGHDDDATPWGSTSTVTGDDAG